MEIKEAVEIIKKSHPFATKYQTDEECIALQTLLAYVQEVPKELPDSEHNCELCGQPVKIYSGEEGTNHYEGIASQIILGLQARIKELENEQKMR